MPDGIESTMFTGVDLFFSGAWASDAILHPETYLFRSGL